MDNAEFCTTGATLVKKIGDLKVYAKHNRETNSWSGCVLCGDEIAYVVHDQTTFAKICRYLRSFIAKWYIHRNSKLPNGHADSRIGHSSTNQICRKDISVKHRPLYEIAKEIGADLKNISDSTFIRILPYIDAMAKLRSLNDKYGFDSGRDIVIRFLIHARTWRGETARKIKAELRDILKIKE
jgi:hypothetical protein